MRPVSFSGSLAASIPPQFGRRGAAAAAAGLAMLALASGQKALAQESPLAGAAPTIFPLSGNAPAADAPAAILVDEQAPPPDAPVATPLAAQCAQIAEGSLSADQFLADYLQALIGSKMTNQGTTTTTPDAKKGEDIPNYKMHVENGPDGPDRLYLLKSRQALTDEGKNDWYSFAGVTVGNAWTGRDLTLMPQTGKVIYNYDGLDVQPPAPCRAESAHSVVVSVAKALLGKFYGIDVRFPGMEADMRQVIPPPSEN